MKAGVSLFVAALAVTGLAETAVVPNASGDLASDETWTPAGGEVVPHGVDTDWEFSTKNGSYTASGDLQAVSISWTKPTTIDLTSPADRSARFSSARRRRKARRTRFSPAVCARMTNRRWRPAAR